MTTEKDYTRLYNRLDELNYLEIETQFLEDQKEGFDNLITSHIQNFASKKLKFTTKIISIKKTRS